MNKEIEQPDFAQLIEDLLATGMTLTEIAKAIKTKQPHISRIKNGHIANPLFITGTRLVNLHRTEMRNFRRALSAAAQEHK
jgi:hypothetical protein